LDALRRGMQLNDGCILDPLSQLEMPTMTTDPTPGQLDRLAAKRAGMKIGFYVHAAVYVAVNLGLVLLSASQGKAWAIYPALGWGLGLFLHGAVTWLALPGGGLREQMVARERRILESRRP
jgi:hypothetical protein